MSAELKVGDVILIENNSQIMADCLLLYADDKNGQCYINTSQLDGERNLKPKQAPQITQSEFTANDSFTNFAKISIDVIDPNKDIYKFDGQIKNLNNG